MNTTSSLILVEELMNPHAVPLQEGIRLGKDLALQLLSGLFSGWPVVNDDYEVIGNVTERDVLTALTHGLDLRYVKPEEVMGISPIFVSTKDPVHLVLKIMVDQKLSKVPVVKNRRLVGVVSRADLLHHLIAPENPKARTLPWCYWCERVKDANEWDFSKEHWCELPYFLLTHQLGFLDVSLAPTYCPQCLKLVKKVIDGNGNDSRSNLGRRVEKKRILVVDDELSITLLLEETLSLWGFDVVTARNGREGLQVLERIAVDGVLLDMDMPIMDGRTMLDELRWLEHQMPVIMMSGRANEHMRQSFLQEGAQDFLMKPFDIKHLETICQRIFGDIQAPSQPNRTLSLVS